MRTEKPTTPKNGLAKLPPALAPLKKLPLWAGWQFTFRDGKWTKPPYQADGPRRNASSNKPEHWCKFDTVLARVQAGAFDGASVLLTPDGQLAGMDLDNAVSGAGSVASWARPFIKRAKAAGVYVEYSPSGRGLRFLGATRCKGAKVHSNDRFDIDGEQVGIEAFRGTAKPLTITGCEVGRGSKKLGCIDGLISWGLGTFVRRCKAKAAKAPKAGVSGNGVDHDYDDIERIVENGADPGTDRSAVFFRIVGSYFGRGHDADWITEHIGQFPGGIGERYIEQGRLADQVEQCVAKYAARDRAQAEAVTAPEQKRTRVSKLKGRAPAEPAPEPEEGEDDLPPLYGHGDAEDPNEPDDWLAQDLLPIPGRSLMGGRSNIGKTFVLIDLAVQVARPAAETPAKFLDHTIPYQAGVLIFSAEGGHRDMQRRVDTAVRIALGNSDTTLPTLPIKWFATFPKLRSDGAMKKLYQIIKKARAQMQREHNVDVKLIAFDTYSASAGFTKANEANDGAVNSDVMNKLLAIAETFHCHVLAVDHPPKGDDGELGGAGVKENASDTWLQCWGHRNKSGRFSNTRVAIKHNRRGGGVGMEYPYTLCTHEIGKRKDDTPITTNTVQWLPPSAFSDTEEEELRAPTDLWVAGLRQEKQQASAMRLKHVMYGLLADPEQAIEAPISEGGTVVRMVPQKAVQAAFFDRTADDEEGEEQTRQAKHAEFVRARNKAEAKQLIGIGQVEGRTHLWLCLTMEAPDGTA